jgi:hypothetical protein
MVFMHAFLAGGTRAVVKGSTGVVRGPLTAQSQYNAELAGGVKIMYPRSKQGVPSQALA